MRAHRVVVMESHRAPGTARLGARLLASLKAARATRLAFETYLQDPLGRFQPSGRLLPDTAAYAFDPSQAALLRIAGLFDLTRVLMRGGYREMARRVARDEAQPERVVAASVPGGAPRMSARRGALLCPPARRGGG